MLPDVFGRAGDLRSALDVLSAMITPAVLILASGSLILTTSNRLTRVLDRVREMAKEVESLGDENDARTADKRTLLFAQLERATRRARLLQHAMTRLYLGLTMFVATSVGIGLIALLGNHLAWLPLIVGFIGAGLLFSASVHLIFESRLALATTIAEMDYVVKHWIPR